MKLLIITQTVDKNDSVLGFFHEWIKEFANQCESVIVVCLKKGKYDLPNNVKVLSLGKENGASKIQYLFNFYKYIWRERKNYNHVFIHMNPEYVVLGGVVWKFLKKKIFLWYTHGTVTLKLEIATFFADTVFTASEKSFRIKSDKVKVVGHGIDTRRFAFSKKKNNVGNPRLISVGRISKIKRQDFSVEVLKRLREDRIDAKLFFVGSPLTEDDVEYKDRIVKFVKENDLNDHVKFLGNVSNDKLPEVLQKNDILIHTSKTGGLDKVVLEAMACGVFVVTTSDAVGEVLPVEYRNESVAKNNIDDVVLKVRSAIENDMTDKLKIGRKYVEDNHGLEALIVKLLV